jgi:hypothetical protein
MMFMHHHNLSVPEGEDVRLIADIPLGTFQEEEFITIVVAEYADIFALKLFEQF